MGMNNTIHKLLLQCSDTVDWVTWSTYNLQN